MAIDYGTSVCWIAGMHGALYTDSFRETGLVDTTLER